MTFYTAGLNLTINLLTELEQTRLQIEFIMRSHFKRRSTKPAALVSKKLSAFEFS